MKVVSDIIWIIGVVVLLVMLVVALKTQHISQRDVIVVCFLAMFSSQIYLRKKRLNNKEAQKTPQSIIIDKLIKIGFYSITPFIVIFYLITTHIEHQDIERCNNASQFDIALHACTNLINKGISEPVVLMKRAAAYLNKGMLEQSMEDLNRSLSGNPNYFASLSLRGELYIVQGKYSAALRDLDHAMNAGADKANNNVIAALLFERGMAKFYAISPALAVEDLLNALQRDSIEDLKMGNIIWLHLARVRSNQNDQQEFERNINRVLTDKWPAPLIALYHDKSTAEEVFLKAKVGDLSEQSAQICDANFYIAELYLSRNMKDEAKNLFQTAADICPEKSVEKIAAHTELSTMKLIK